MTNNPFGNWRPGLKGGASPEFYKDALTGLYVLLGMMFGFTVLMLIVLFFLKGCL